MDRFTSKQGCARDLLSRDRDVQNFVRDETETRRCSFRDAGSLAETLKLSRELQRLAETFSVTYDETH